uniref:Jacalin-type lectin domain-containing protein n=1 Tax=Brassica oleracea TaxID=3712 RepID=A0A3P6F2N0_BRAOL|nr:unnamed protein product [Brassica oleracea]
MSWDDGTARKVKKVHITYDDVIYSVQFTLESDEYITALSGYALSTQDVVTSLTFTTNKKTYGPYGNKFGYQISAPEKTGKQIAGFHGTKDSILNSIDVHYAPIPTGTGGSETGSGAQRLPGEGLVGGTAWDDGSDHDGVTNIYVASTLLGIKNVMFGYMKDGSKQGGHHGGDPTKQEIVINHPDEHLVSVEGWYESSSKFIMGIQFKTNYKICASMGYRYEGDNDYKFTLQVQDKKIIGFHGFASNHLNSIGAYFSPLSSTTTLPIGTGSSGAQKLGAQGVTGGSAWDDGSYHDGVTKIVVRTCTLGVQFVNFYYDNDIGAVHGAPGDPTGSTHHIVINHPDEHLVSIEGWYISNYISGIRFKTNQKTSGYIGYEYKGSGTIFTLQVQDKKIIGFHGFASDHLNSIGAYFVPVPSTSTLPIVPPKRFGAVWDDGTHDKVKKVFIGLGQDVIASVKFEYINGSGVVNGVEHGTPTLLGFEEVHEYITALSAYVETLSTQDVVTSLTFTTNKKNYGPYGNKSGFQIFAPEETGKQIAGFHGTSGNVLNSISGYYAPIPTYKLVAVGGTGGSAWDDGSDHDGVTKITVRTGGVGIQYVKFDYVKAGQPKQGTLHGVHGSRGSTREIVINHPDEHLVSVEGWYDSSNVILGIQFKTNQKTSDYLGYESEGTGTKFTLQDKDKKIIGFHGFASDHLNSIGAYFVLLPSTTTTIPIVPPKKLGAVWDDGTHDKVKKVFVGLAQDGIASVKFVYINGSYRVNGIEHGTPTLLGFEEFTLGSYEYITALSAYTKTLSTQDIVTSLTFTTNKKTYGPYGKKSGFLFTFPEDTGKQIAGFHGTSGNVLNSIQVHYAPIPTVQKLDAQGGTGGTEWDDGSDHDGVTNIYVRSNMDGIQYVSFDYEKAGQPKQGAHHGGSGSRGSKGEIAINHPDEQVVSVEGWYDSANVICGVRFRTNQKIYDYMGYKFDRTGTKFTLKVQDKKPNHRVSQFRHQPAHFPWSLFCTVTLRHRPSYRYPEGA